MTLLMSGNVTVLLKVINSATSQMTSPVASAADDLTITEISAQISSWILLAVNN